MVIVQRNAIKNSCFNFWVYFRFIVFMRGTTKQMSILIDTK